MKSEWQHSLIWGMIDPPILIYVQFCVVGTNVISCELVHGFRPVAELLRYSLLKTDCLLGGLGELAELKAFLATNARFIVTYHEFFRASGDSQWFLSIGDPLFKANKVLKLPEPYSVLERQDVRRFISIVDLPK